MLRIGIVVCAWLLHPCSAIAETPAQRGDYLVNTIMACGNCHTPRDAEGRPIAGEALSGGLTFNTPAFVATAPNITPDAETGIGSWSDAEIKRALVEGTRPDHGHFAGVSWRRSCRPTSTRRCCRTISPPSLPICAASSRSGTRCPIPSTRRRFAAIPTPTPKPDSSKTKFADPAERGAYLVTIGHCMECHSAWSRGVSDFKTGLGRGGRVFPPRKARRRERREHRAQHHVASNRRHRQLDRRRNRPRGYPGWGATAGH